MNNELIPLSGAIVPSKYADDKAFNEVASSGFLPRLSLMNATSDLVKEAKMNQGCYAVVSGKDNFTDLGREVQCLPLAWRPKALDMNDPVTAAYNPQSELFKKIAAGSEEPNSRKMYGPEFLVWVPFTKQFATFFCGGKTTRRCAPEVRALLGKRMTLKSQLIKTPKNSWFGPVITICSVEFELPSSEEAIEQVNKFNNPPESEQDLAPTDDRPR